MSRWSWPDLRDTEQEPWFFLACTGNFIDIDDTNWPHSMPLGSQIVDRQSGAYAAC